jgi:transposase
MCFNQFARDLMYMRDIIPGRFQQMQGVSMTGTESKVINILVKSARSADPWREPIHDVDAAMHWDSVTTRKFVRGLQESKLIVERMNAVGKNETPRPLLECWWERAGG